MGLNVSYIHLDEYFQQFLTKITVKSCITIEYPISTYNEIIKKFLNPYSNEEWSVQKLNDGLESYINFYSFSLNDDFFKMQIGRKTSRDPKFLNEIMIYRICKEINYEMNIDTEFNEMAFVVSNYLNSGKFRFLLSQNIKRLNSSDVLKISYKLEESQLSENIQETNIVKKEVKKHDSLIAAANYLNDITFLITRISPSDNSEAIVLGVRKWNVFLGECENPIHQYKLLNKYGKERYVPKNDVDFQIKYIKNKNWYNTERNWFEELIPIYESKKLINIAISEGLTNERKLNFIKHCLANRLKVTNFYFEVVPYSDSEITYINRYQLDEVENLICMGNISTNEYFYFSTEELLNYFNYNRRLLDCNGNVIDKYSVEKLKNHCLNMINKKISRGKFSNLMKIILEIEKNGTIVKKINITDEGILVVEPILRKICELGMKMRGKDIKNVLPLSTEDCLVTKEEEYFIYQYSFDFYKECLKTIEDSTDEARSFIESIDIITFSDSGEKIEVFGEILKAPNIDYTISLIQCMARPFFSGELDDFSCIRYNSNWILYTASWYLKSLGFELGYKMQEINELL